MGEVETIYDSYKGMQKLRKEKRNAIRKEQGLPPERPWYVDCAINCSVGAKDTLVRAFCPCCIMDADTRKQIFTGGSCIQRMFMDGKHENLMLKSCLGFVGGLAMTSAWYFVLVLQLSYTPAEALVICTLLGFGLSLGLAFSVNVRFLTFLMLPSMFTGTGRNVLLGVLFVMVLSGPMVNFQHNLQVLADTQSCGQQQAYNATQELVDSAMAPLKDMVSSIQAVLEGMLQLAEKMRESLMCVRDLFSEIVSAVDRAFSWLDVMVDQCNTSMGGPFESCMAAFEQGAQSCRDTLPFYLDWACSIVDVVSNVCHIARILQAFCIITQALTNIVADTIDSGVDFVMTDVYDMFSFNVSLVYVYEVSMNTSQDWEDIQHNIKQEIKDKLSPLTSFAEVSHVLLIFSVVWLFSKSLIYRHKFLTKDRFDNQFITVSLKALDESRKKKDMEQIMPLQWREKHTYINTTSYKLADGEIKKLLTGLALLFGSLLNIVFYLGCDYGMYWLLDLIRRHGDVKVNQQMPSHLRLHVEGEGVLSDMYRSLISQFDPIDKLPNNVDTTTCLPNPREPNYNEYINIGILFGVCMLLVLTEAYGLRLRHVIAGCYHPRREKERSIWLFNHILRRRGSFLKFMRRKLRSRYNYEEETKKISMLQRIATQWPTAGKVLRYLGMSKDEYCLACGIAPTPMDKDTFVRCTNNCKAVYCKHCFAELQNMCTVCMQPLQYGDFSDFSEEKDSSDDDKEKPLYSTEQNLLRYFRGELRPSSSKSKPIPATMATFDADAGKDLSSDEEGPVAPRMDRK